MWGIWWRSWIIQSPGVSKSRVFLTITILYCITNGTEQKNPQLCSLIPGPQAIMLPVELCTHLSLYRATFAQKSECLCGTTHCPGLLKINLRCVARGCLGDASEREEAGRKWVDYARNSVDTSDSTVKQWVNVCFFSSSYYAESVYAPALVSLLRKDLQIIENSECWHARTHHSQDLLDTFQNPLLMLQLLKDSEG